MNSKYKTLAAATFALLLLAACGSSGNGGLGSIFGGGSNTNRSYEIHGTVDSVDFNSHSIYLTSVSGYNSMLSSGGSNNGNNIRVYYDNRTSVDYQGRIYHPEDLERGDQVTVRVDQSSNQLLATAMTVTYNARASNTGSYPSSGGVYGNNSTLHGTVRSIDTNRRTISLDRGYGSTISVQYDTNTPVYFNGQNYRPTDLENGDELDVRVTDLGSGRYTAQDITVTRSVSNNGNGTYGTSPAQSTIRGTVRSVDTYNRTITLDTPSYTGFNRNTAGGTITVQYDTNANVDVNGQAYPISGLQRGDIIDVQVSNQGGSNYLAQRITLVKDVNQR